MAKFQLGFAKYSPKPKRARITVSPQAKFDRLARRLKNKGKSFQLRRFHFNAIEAGKTIIVFDGEGNEVIQTDNSRNGYILARKHCLAMFFNSDNQNGGFSFTTSANLEYQSLEELKLAREMTKKNLDFVVEKEKLVEPIKCNYCFFEFPNNAEFNMHQCEHGAKGWVVFEFVRVGRREMSMK